MIRFAAPADAEALLAIYAQYIGTSVTFEYDLPSPDGFRARIESISRTYPYLVFEEEGRILGYAYAHRYRERTAYQWGAELSVYVDGSAHGKGVGTKLYRALMELLALQGLHTVYGFVTQPNEKSDRLHLSLGFSLAGVVHRAGFKAGRWHDVATYEKEIRAFDAAPAPPKSVGELDPAAVDLILKT